MVVLIASLLIACRGSHGRGRPPSGPVPPAAHPSLGRSLGLNVAGVDYWGQEWTFVDLVKRAKDWGEKPGSNYTVDKDGWISSMAPGTKHAALIGDPDLHFQRNFPIGRYVALYEGEGRVSIDCQRCREVSRKPGRLVVDIGETTYVQIVIESVEPSNYLRNLRVVPQEFEATYLTHPFHPKFLEGLRAFAAVRHFGNQKTNGNPQVHWADRTKSTAVFQDAEGGVAVEYMVQMANTSATDPWFCIPPRADDDYVRNFARAVFGALDGERKVYVELGNEIWNEAPPYGDDGKWMAEQARRLKIPLPADDDGSDMTLRLRYQVYRSRQIFELFQAEMKALKIDPRRLVRVIASQASFFDRIRFTLDYKFPDGSFGYQHADALAVAPYFAGLWTDKESELAEHRWTVDEVLDYAECSVTDLAQAPAKCKKIPFEPVAKIIRGDWEMAKARGLRLLGYEGGQHMVAWNGHPNLIEKLATVNRSPRMKSIYTTYLNTWRDNGGELLFLLGYVQSGGKHGYWGMLERQDQPLAQAPKFAAALQFTSQQPAWWTDPWPMAAAVNPAKGAGPHPSADAGASTSATPTPGAGATAPRVARPSATAPDVPGARK
ncbi:MAG: hypothetical protein ABIS92_10865 [Polyangia bacterium]